eukprot:SAG31_NODE_33062_length_348_cov_0.835341_1_plen_27_part_10
MLIANSSTMYFGGTLGARQSGLNDVAS